MILLFFTLIALLIYYVWKRRNLLHLASKLKGPSGYPIIGSAYKFLDPLRKYDNMILYHTLKIKIQKILKF